ncbi:hypothetical protein [Kluyvera sp. CRP]|uniref:hypothetical protein n=1 Tax=Kluyvera sp. CRP TaxID=2873269 RepID=UPI001CC1E3C0|nr:hypothetical protein [Kluyvera sp. CRP]UAK18629.1 hypothetical protein K7B04_14940 [Kluyvera sp. CRP]
MENDNLDIRLKAIEYAIGRIATAISEGTSPKEFVEETKRLSTQLSSGFYNPQNEAIVRQTIMLLDPLNGDPWDSIP